MPMKKLLLSLALVAGSTQAAEPIRVEIHCRSVASASYPGRAVDRVRLRINLPARYPFERPTVTIETPIFHPNVFTSGVVCQGDRWIPSEGLDLLVKRMIRLVTFDPAHVNPASAANRSAASWYLAQRSLEPSTFPTDRLSFDEGRPGAVTDEATRVLRRCPHCQQALRLPAGRRGTVACPSCRRDFDVTT